MQRKFIFLLLFILLVTPTYATVTCNFYKNTPPTTSVNWFSLDLDTNLTTANELIMDIEGWNDWDAFREPTNISQVGIFNPIGQSVSDSQFWDSDFGEWSGVDFNLVAGAGYMIVPLQNFTWDCGENATIDGGGAPATTVLVAKRVLW